MHLVEFSSFGTESPLFLELKARSLIPLMNMTWVDCENLFSVTAFRNAECLKLIAYIGIPIFTKILSGNL